MATAGGVALAKLTTVSWPLSVAILVGAVGAWRRCAIAVAMAAWGGVGWGAGAWSRAHDLAACERHWRPGPRAAHVVLLDRIGGRGATGSARVVSDDCTGIIRVRLDADFAADGGSHLLAVGSWRGVLKVRHARELDRPPAVRGWIRGRLEARLEQLFGSRSDAAVAMTLARWGAIQHERRERYVAAGLAHLLAISGLHVGFVAWWLRWGWGRLGGSASTAAVLAALLAAGYAWSLGFPPAATRAALFIGITTVATLRQRRVAPSGVLALAALIIVIADPGAVMSTGAWLSMGAVAGLCWSARALPRWKAVAPTLGATLFTAPITAFSFGTVAPVGILSNLVGVPLAAITIPGIFLAAGASFVAPGVANTLASGAGAGLAALDFLADRASRLPYSHTATEPGWRAAMAWAALLAAAVWARWRQPTLWVSCRRVAAPLALAAWISVAAGVVSRNQGPHLAIHFLAVGQGDATAIRTPGGHWILVDGGPRSREWDAGRRVVVPFLRRQGVSQVDVVVLTHADADHIGGLPAAIRRLRPRLVWEPGDPVGEPLYFEFLAAVEQSAARWHRARTGDRLAVDSVHVVVRHPDPVWLQDQLERNENSVVLEIRYRDFRAVLPGDAGVPMERVRAVAIGDITVLKVGHHGSQSATSAEWLDILEPEIAVISVGRRNRYGHPAPAVLRRLASRRVAVYRTDRDGSVVVRTDGHATTVTTTK